MRQMVSNVPWRVRETIDEIIKDSKSDCFQVRLTVPDTTCLGYLSAALDRMGYAHWWIILEFCGQKLISQNSFHNVCLGDQS